jgi:hypothetical protein
VPCVYSLNIPQHPSDCKKTSDKNSIFAPDPPKNKPAPMEKSSDQAGGQLDGSLADVVVF